VTSLVYVPMLLGCAQVRFADSRKGLDVTENVQALAPLTDGAVPVDWDHGTPVDLAIADLEEAPADGAQFGELPAPAGKAKSYESWAKEFAGWLFRTQKLEVLRSPSTKAVSKPGESEGEFRVRLQQASRETRDRQAEQLRQAYAPKIASLQERLRKAELDVEEQIAQAKQAGLQAAISVGATILGAFMGRKTISAATLGKATTALRGAGRTMKEARDVGQAKENVGVLQQQLADLESQFKREADHLAAVKDPQTEKFETLALKPAKSDIAVKLVTLAWTPHWRDEKGCLTPA
jgi:hypothetical protein